MFCFIASKRITISVPVEMAEQIRQAARKLSSVSEWVTNAAARSLEEESLKRRFLEWCAETPATSEEQARALRSIAKIRGIEKLPRTRKLASRKNAA
jgi:hypothetical protein